MTIKDGDNDFSKIAHESSEQSLIREFVEFLKTDKKWWLAPILVVIMLMGAMLLLSGSAAAPFIYTLF